MKKQNLMSRIMGWVATIGFQLFIWGNKTTEEKYWQEVWEQENRERSKMFVPQPEEAEVVDMWEHRNHIQNTTAVWIHRCFPEGVIYDKTERNFRFLEEALELVQANGATRAEALILVDYVFNREVGETLQEVGGVMVTLAALCNVLQINMESAYWLEHNRISTDEVIAKIRKKQETKPKGSPLPGTHEVTPIWETKDDILVFEFDEVYIMQPDRFGYLKNPKLVKIHQSIVELPGVVIFSDKQKAKDYKTGHNISVKEKYLEKKAVADDALIPGRIVVEKRKKAGRNLGGC